MRTECCNRPICDYRTPGGFLEVPYRGDCYYDHDRYTLCSTHKTEHHDGPDWRDCQQCLGYSRELEWTAWAGTSNFNFAQDHWENAPTFEPSYCSKCRGLIKLNAQNYVSLPHGEVRHSGCG